MILGSGTAEDPWVPETFEDFIQVCNNYATIDLYGPYCKLPKDVVWDMRDIDPDGTKYFSEPVHLPRYLDGDGATLLNLTYPAENQYGAFDVDLEHTIDNLHFIDFRCMNKFTGLIYNSYGGKGTYTNCTFKGFISISSNLFYGSNNVTCDRCSLILTLDAKASISCGANGYGHGTTLLHCYLYLDNYSTYNLFRGASITALPTTYCYILGNLREGKLKCANCGTLIDLYVSRNGSLEYTLPSSEKFNRLYPTIINTDKVEDASVLTLADGVLAVTTEQLNDIEWLRSQGYHLLTV